MAPGRIHLCVQQIAPRASYGRRLRTESRCSETESSGQDLVRGDKVEAVAVTEPEDHVSHCWNFGGIEGHSTSRLGATSMPGLGQGGSRLTENQTSSKPQKTFSSSTISTRLAADRTSADDAER